MKGKAMSDHNPNDRIYMRPNKPANEMTEEMYNRIMGILPGREESDEK
jgi:hypothetical protein